MSTDDVATTPGGSKLTAKGRATRARIVDAAATLIFEKGVAGTSLDDVQRQAGVGASQLYHYFTDKQMLIHAVIPHQADAILQAQQPLLDQLDSFDAFRAWRDLLVDMQKQRHCQGGCPIGSLAGELNDTDPEARAELALGFDRWEKPIRDGLQSMLDRGDLRPGTNPAALALATLAALQGGLLLTQTRRETTPLETALDSMIDYIRSFAA